MDGTVFACVLKHLGIEEEAVLVQMVAMNVAREEWSGDGWPDLPRQKFFFVPTTSVDPKRVPQPKCGPCWRHGMVQHCWNHFHSASMRQIPGSLAVVLPGKKGKPGGNEELLRFNE